MTAYTWIGGGVLMLAAVLGFGMGNIPADAGFAGITPRFYPTVITGLLAFLGVCLIWQSRRGGKNQAEDPADSVIPAPNWQAAIWVIAALLLSAFLIEKIGFVLSSTLLFVLSARGFGSRRYLRNMLLGLAICLPIFWLFTLVLTVSLPKLVNAWL
jgi:putative tricarboxylic transport membrane protein